MKVIIIGDIHGDFPKIDKIINNTKADLYLQVGDLAGSLNFDEWFYTPFSKPIIFISGNHENYDVLEPYNRREINNVAWEIEQNLYYLPIGNYVDWEGLRIGGLGGNFAPSRYNLTRDKLDGGRRRHYTINEVERLKRAKSVDILLTHEAPTPFYRNPYFTSGEDMGKKEITELVKFLKPKYHFFGHHHVSRQLTIGNTICYCVPIFNYVELEL